MNDFHDVFYGTAAREVGGGIIEALEDGAGGGKATKLFKRFVEDVAGVEIGADKDIGLAGDSGMRGFFASNSRVDRGVKLEFAVNENIEVLGADALNDILN